MAKATSTNYANPSFTWGTVGDDPFAITDLENLAQALEGHDHTVGKGAPSGMNRIAQVLGDNIATTIDIQNIPLIYENLYLTVQGRFSDAVLGQTANLRLNNDSGTNYYGQMYNQNNAGNAVSQALATNSAPVGVLPGSTAPAGASGGFQLTIPSYRRTGLNRRFLSNGGYRGGSAGNDQWITTASGEWVNQALAVNRITIFGGGAAISGLLVVTLYGMP